ncbi:hypothetical protein U9M48_037206 [Paspalum notatum var. saurae]|uniref:RING-type domain-containing protein n=1 Tax=Paspalum notatum var. saurae TaxID=547442 RepID=A0AAQ3XAT9_PASNO
MTIASKLIYFQRRPSPAPPDPGPEAPDPRRRPCRDDRRRRSSSFSSSHHKPEPVPGHQRDAASKSPVPAGTATEHVAGGTGSSARLHHSASDHGRLPDAVQQARERLLHRLNSVDLSGRRQKAWPPETLWAGRPARHTDIAGVSTSYSDIILTSLTNCFQFPPCDEAASKVEERAAEHEHVGTNTVDAGELTPAAVAVPPEPVGPEAVEAEYGGAVATAEVASPAECAICLERCGGPDDGEGVVVRLPCTHVFHSACLDRWLRSRADCPYCRAAVLRS